MQWGITFHTSPSRSVKLKCHCYAACSFRLLSAFCGTAALDPFGRSARYQDRGEVDRHIASINLPILPPVLHKILASKITAFPTRASGGIKPAFWARPDELISKNCKKRKALKSYDFKAFFCQRGKVSLSFPTTGAVYGRHGSRLLDLLSFLSGRLTIQICFPRLSSKPVMARSKIRFPPRLGSGMYRLYPARAERFETPEGRDPTLYLGTLTFTTHFLQYSGCPTAIQGA